MIIDRRLADNKGLVPHVAVPREYLNTSYHLARPVQPKSLAAAVPAPRLLVAALSAAESEVRSFG